MNESWYNSSDCAGRYTIGRVVQKKKLMSATDKDCFGHVVGFGRNRQGELLIAVQWENKANSFEFKSEITYMHPANLINCF